MIKYANPPEVVEATWKTLCAKNGLPEAAGIGNEARGYDQMTKNELHEMRKTARRAVNKITDALRPEEYTDRVADALLFAGSVVNSINQHFERAEDAAQFFGLKRENKSMQNVDDFERHYGIVNNRDDEQIGITEFLRGVAKLRTTPAVQNALATGTDTAGGFTVPSRLMPGILGALVPVSSLMQAGASILPLEDGAKTFSTAAINAIPTAAWRSEAGALATSEPTFRSVVATPRSLAFTFKISRELLADGQGIQEALYLAIGQAFAKELDRVGLRGTGTAPEPRGILNTSGIQSVTNGTNGTALANYANIFSAVQAILQADAPLPMAAIMSPRSLVRMGGFVDTAGQPMNTPEMLKGMKMIGTSQIPNNLTVGSSTDCSEIYVGDFSRMYFAMRENISIQQLNELHAATGEVGFACHLRADVVLTYPAAFAVVTGVR